MGVYRIVKTKLACLQCLQSYIAEAQFKTGEDRSMPIYNEGDVVADIDPGEYEGIADSLCKNCLDLWHLDVAQADLDQLADEVDCGDVIVRREPDPGSKSEPPTLTRSEVIALATLLPTPARENFQVCLNRARLTLWVAEHRIFPHDSSNFDVTWWVSHNQRVDSRMRALGWNSGANHWIDLTVIVKSDKKIAVAPRPSGRLLRGEVP